MLYKIIVAVCVFDRFENIKKWISCWPQCNTESAELVIVHNYYNDLDLKNKFESLCKESNVLYVGCNRPGFDVGRFQDICRNRLNGFPDYDYLLWCTDDCIPMQKDFITPFINGFNNPKAGVVAMEISPSVSMHIRTTGFCIKKEIASKLKFPADPITTKQHCYLFEHRDRKKTFYDQIVSMGLIPVQVAPAKTSPLWDQGYWRRLDRMAEHDNVFNPDKKEINKVCIIATIFDAYPQIISSLICQDYKKWELILIDDNPAKTNTKAIVDAANDDRIKYIKRERAANYGHPHRQWALNEIKENRLAKDSAFILISNADNYMAPPFLSYMLEGFKKNPLAKAVYSSSMVHSYIAWNVIQCKLQKGFIDCGNVMVRKEIAAEVGWKSMEHSADWIYFESIIKQYSMKSFAIAKGCIFVHN